MSYMIYKIWAYLITVTFSPIVKAQFSPSVLGSGSIDMLTYA